MKEDIFRVELHLELRADDEYHPKKWDWNELLDLLPGERATLISCTKVGSVDSGA